MMHQLVAIVGPILAGLSVVLLVRALFPTTLLDAVRARREQLAQDQDKPTSGMMALYLRGGPAKVVAFPVVFLTLLLETMITMLGDLNRRFIRPAWAEKMRKKFLTMGQPELRPEEFRARQQIFAAMFALLMIPVMRTMGSGWATTLWASLVCAGLGYGFPQFWVRDQIARRHKSIRKDLPYHLDLLTSAVEAGLDFAQGLGTMVERGRPGPLLEELMITVKEMKLGKTRGEALRNLGDRVQLIEMSTFVSSIIQADKMGTSLAKVLRVQSAQMRVMRAQAAETAANQAPVKMLMPLVLCFFPTVFMILFGPIIYRMFLGG